MASPRCGDQVEWTERPRQELPLLQLVTARGSRRGTRRRRPTHFVERMATEERLSEAQPQVASRAHVLRFFLHPHGGRLLGVGRERATDLRIRERVELLDAHDGHVLSRELLPFLFEVESDLPG